NAGLDLKDLILDGTGASTNQTIVYDDDLNAYAALKVQDSEIKNYPKGMIYINKKALVESITFQNNIIHDIDCTGGGFVDFRAGFAKTFLFENNTVYNITEDGSRDLFRMDNAAAYESETSIITIRANTFYKALNRAKGRYLYIRIKNNEISFVKNLIAETENYYTNQSATNIVSLTGNNYYNAPNFTGSSEASA